MNIYFSFGDIAIPKFELALYNEHKLFLNYYFVFYDSRLSKNFHTSYVGR